MDTDDIVGLQPELELLIDAFQLVEFHEKVTSWHGLVVLVDVVDEQKNCGKKKNSNVEARNLWYAYFQTSSQTKP